MKTKLILSAFIASSFLVSCASSDQRPTSPTTSTGTSSRPSAGATTRPTVAAPAPVSKPLWGQYYTVKKSEGLYRIAVNHGILLRDLAAWNGLYEPYNLTPGQRLRLFPRTGGPSTSSNVATPTVYTGAPASSGFTWAWPVKGNLVGWFQPGEPTKQGIGIAGQVGDAIKASADGTVVYSGNGLVGYGELVIVKHNEQWLSAYGHNRRRLVKEGDRVSRGQQIAEMGTSAGVPQLHFEIRYNGKPVDPRAYLPR